MLFLCTMQSLTGELVNIDLHMRRNDDIVDDKQGFTHSPELVQYAGVYARYIRVRLEPGQDL